MEIVVFNPHIVNKNHTYFSRETPSKMEYEGYVDVCTKGIPENSLWYYGSCSTNVHFRFLPIEDIIFMASYCILPEDYLPLKVQKKRLSRVNRNSMIIDTILIFDFILSLLLIIWNIK